MLSQTMENRVHLGEEGFWFETCELLSIFSNRHVREFNDEYSKTRIFSHQNILPALGTVNKPEVTFILILKFFFILIFGHLMKLFKNSFFFVAQVFIKTTHPILENGSKMLIKTSDTCFLTYFLFKN